MNCHAEQIALKKIHMYYSKIYKITDIKILIWKQNNFGEIRPIHCCNWCSKLPKHYNFPPKNIYTLSKELSTMQDYLTITKKNLVYAINPLFSKAPLLKKTGWNKK